MVRGADGGHYHGVILEPHRLGWPGVIAIGLGLFPFLWYWSIDWTGPAVVIGVAWLVYGVRRLFRRASRP